MLLSISEEDPLVLSVPLFSLSKREGVHTILLEEGEELLLRDGVVRKHSLVEVVPHVDQLSVLFAKARVLARELRNHGIALSEQIRLLQQLIVDETRIASPVEVLGLCVVYLPAELVFLL